MHEQIQFFQAPLVFFGFTIVSAPKVCMSFTHSLVFVFVKYLHHIVSCMCYFRNYPVNQHFTFLGVCLEKSWHLSLCQSGSRANNLKKVSWYHSALLALVLRIGMTIIKGSLKLVFSNTHKTIWTPQPVCFPDVLMLSGRELKIISTGCPLYCWFVHTCCTCVSSTGGKLVFNFLNLYVFAVKKGYVW